MSEQENRSPESERARRDVREALLRYVSAKGTAGASSVPAAFANFVDVQLRSLTRDGVLAPCGSSSTGYRLSDAEMVRRLAAVAGEVKDGPCGTFKGAMFAESLVERFALVLSGSPLEPRVEEAGASVVSGAAVARRLAEYALDFVERSCGPDVDALAERFGEILSGKTAEDDPTRTDVSARTREQEPTCLEEAIESLRVSARCSFHLRARKEARVAPALAHGAERSSARRCAVREARARRADACCQLGGFDGDDMWGELVALLDFVHSEVLKESVPPRGGQPIPHA